MSAEVPDWLAEVLHVTVGFALREHQGLHTSLTPAHAEMAIRNVPRSVLEAAGAAHLVDRLD